MTTITEEPPNAPLSEPVGLDPAARLRAAVAAARVSFTWFGVRKTLTPEQKSQAAESFGAESAFLSAGKKLLDTSHTAFKEVVAIRGRITAYWKAASLPYPEPGIRLIHQDDLAAFNVQLTSHQQELDEAVERLDGHYGELVAAARHRLGRLFNAADYPRALRGLFGVGWDFPSIEPPDYLRRLSPQLYHDECRRAASRFDEAVRLAEEAFAAELSKLVSHLAERLAGDEDGKPKIFRDSAVENLREFFERFKHLNIGSSEQLDQLVGRAQRILRGAAPDNLRVDGALRQRVATKLAAVQASLDGLMVDRPRRNIMRRAH